MDEAGTEVFRHNYVPMDLENENGFIFYQSEDAESGQFTYFAFSPDTMVFLVVLPQASRPSRERSSSFSFR